MNSSTWDETVAKYAALFTKTHNIRTPRPKHLSPGVSWSTKEADDIHKEMDEILKDIQLDALRRFIIDVDSKLEANNE